MTTSEVSHGTAPFSSLNLAVSHGTAPFSYRYLAVSQ